MGQSLHSLYKRIDHPKVVVHSVKNGFAAILLSDCERARGIELAQQLLRAVRKLLSCETTSGVSIGLATVEMAAKNFSAQKLLSAAEGCLQSAHTSGGRTVKSITVY